MKMKLLAGAAIAAIFASTTAFAEQTTGWYGALDLGVNQKDKWGAKSQNNAPDGKPFQYDVSTEDSLVGFARLGYRYSPNWRVEFEAGAREGDVDSAIGGGANEKRMVAALCTPNVIRTAGSRCGSPKGTFTQTGVMANLIYDIFPDSAFHPFVGVGVGAVQVKSKFYGQFSTSPMAGPAHLFLNDTDTVPAAQGLLGMSWNFSERTALDVTYRYTALAKTTISSKSSNTTAVWTPGDFSGDFNNQALTVGLRMAFGAPAAPPPPPAPPAPEPTPTPTPPPPPPVVEAPKAVFAAKEYIVYFDHNKSDITAESQAVISEAASYAKEGNAVKIVVVGHADTSGSAAYNVKLSERRSKVVADALAALGVNTSTLSLDWKGESQLAKSTKDGVKEPLNRRSTVNISF